MIHLNFCLAAISAVNIWSRGHAEGCDDRQVEVNGRCCNLCPPGHYMEQFCSEQHQTVCSPCEEGFYSIKYNIFDRCEQCHSCQQEYVEKCTPTTNANCSCHSGFLCSNNICSRCEENKCVTGEKVTTTDTSLGQGLIEYSHQCEPLCPESSYFDINEDVCKQRTLCSLLGLTELFPGKTTQNAVCDGERHGNDGEDFHVILVIVIGFILLSLIVPVLLFLACLRKTAKHKARNNSIDVVAVVTYPSDSHLSKEESGLQLINIDESKQNNSLEQPDP